ncbi:DUF6197 family protein [Antarcticirhabdus aurantiaca]|uniref:DUF6197 family protein n=1 Tax=Antarcticirhabdus aurantiaca TaxID=2606717 RepID=UPI00131B6C6A|nr:hypothetical protein [Antarcticirhabdus aurantiaca]
MKTNESFASASSSRSDMLRDVRGFIERGWTQGATARDAEGFRCVPRDPRAECWCLLGAAVAVAVAKGITDPLARSLGFETGVAMVIWNDTKGRTKAEVLARIDQALERAGGGE